MPKARIQHYLLPFGMLLVAISCHDASITTAPLMSSLPSAFSIQALTPFSGSLSSAGGSSLTLTPYDFAEGVKVEIRIAGTISVMSDPRAPYVNLSPLTLDAGGVWVGSVYQQCYLRAHVTYGTTSNTLADYGPTTPCTVPRTMQDYVTTAVVTGTGYALRNTNIPEEHVPCDTITCHSYPLGSQLVTVTPLPADLFVAATWLNKTGKTVFVTPFTPSNYYQYVHFAESSLPTGMPIKVLSRAWRMADSTNPGTGTGNSNFAGTCIGNVSANPPIYPGSVCDVAIKESGVMTTTTRVNGVVHVDSAMVECATGDSSLDDASIRTSLISAIRLSDNVNPTLRRERAGQIFEDTLTHTFFAVPDSTAFSTDCYVMPTNMTPPAGLIQWGQYHTHPSFAPDSASQCLDSFGRPYHHKVQINPSLNGGGSDSDWSLTNSGFPEYVIALYGDMFKLAANSQNLTSTQKAANPNRWPWKRGRCEWTANN